MSEDIKKYQAIAQQWMDASALTASNNDFDAHFNLISKKGTGDRCPGF